MERSSNKCEVADIPKKNRSLDLKSVYESSVRGAKKIGSDEGEHEGIKKRKRKNRKEFPLSFFQSDAKKSRKEGVNGVVLERKSESNSQSFHRISLAFSDAGASFVIPKRPRGTVERKKLDKDQTHEPLIVSSSIDHVETSEKGVTDTQEELTQVDTSVKSGGAFPIDGGVSNSKISKRLSDNDSKSKLDTDSKPNVGVISSSENLKHKEKAGEVNGSTSDHSVYHEKDAKIGNLDQTQKSSTDKKITAKSRRSKLKSRSKSDASDLNRNSQSSSFKDVSKGHMEAGSKKMVRKSTDSNSKARMESKGHEVEEAVDIQPISVLHESSKAGDYEDETSKMPRWKNRKKSDLMIVRDSRNASKRKAEPSTGSSVSNNHFADGLDDDDDDEENLEKNAARMLSSRFDPNCTGYSRRRYSAVHKPSYITGSMHEIKESESVDEKSRALRPRREDTKGIRRKRRHFYEILPGDLDPYWVLSQRVKIFWPLDESWYYGVVDEYHSESKLHHIKYDDRDEEWVNLLEEKFKILLLPGEAPGKSKSRKRAAGERLSQNTEEDRQSDDNLLTENCPDSEPIASWLVNQQHLAKSSSKSLKGQRTSQEQQSLVASLSSGDAFESDADYSGPKLKENGLVSDVNENDRNCQSECSSRPGKGSLSGKNVVYVRRRYRGNALKGRSVFENGAFSDSLMRNKGGRVSGWMNSNMPLWFFDNCNKLKLNEVLMKSNDVRFQIHLPMIRVMDFSCELMGPFWLAHFTFMLQNGVIVTTSPAILLEMLFLDNSLGLNLLLFEGCLREAVALFSIVLIVFSQSKGYVDGNMGLPVTSIRFRIFSVHELEKQHVFVFYSFTGLESAKWLYLESKILHHCFLTKRLSVLDCTPDKIMELEHGSSQLSKPHSNALPSNEYLGPSRKLPPTIFPLVDFQETHRTSQSAISLAAKLGQSLHLVLSDAPSFFQSLHMQLLMQNSLSCINVHHQTSINSHTQRVAERTPLCDLQDCLTEAPASKGLRSYRKDQKVDAGFSRNVSVCQDKSELSVDYRRCTTRMMDESQVCEPWDASESFSSGFSKPVKRGRISLLSSPPECHSPTSPDGMPNFTARPFSIGPKKPRTQVQYSLPYVGYDFSSNQKLPNSAALPYKRIRRASHKKISDANGSNQKIFDLLTCAANILVTQGNKGWREHGASIALEHADHNEWRLAIKQSGVPRYYYKVKDILQPGSANRFSHAMMWKGGKDWMLEFPGRNQWMLFKEMYEECYNRNLRAASVKNIPIPGVKLVEEYTDYGTDATFSRNSARYIRQVQNDVEMAMDPSRILYDMDSDDERWLLGNSEPTLGHKYAGISDEFLEKAMDMFEKFSYAQLREEFTDSEVEELIMGLGSIEAGKTVYEYWRKKREKMGMPLVRHLQPPHWEIYQQKLKEWDHIVARFSSTLSDGSHERLIPTEKPPLFAFCLKPRGLDVPNKFLKQRSQRKLPIAMSNHASLGNQDSLHGRISNGHAFIDEKTLHASSVHYSSDASPSLLASTRVLSPRDAQFSLSADALEWNGPPELALAGNYYYGVTYTESAKLHSNIHEFHARDASGAAIHARKLANFKKQRAERLLCKADIAIHRAAIALMAAEAIRDSADG